MARSYGLNSHEALYRMARVNGITQFLPATHTTILTLLCKHSPDGTTRTRRHASDIAYYSIYRPRKNERLSWPSCLTYSGRFTHISGHPSAAGRAWDRKVRRSKTNVLTTCHVTNQRRGPPWVPGTHLGSKVKAHGHEAQHCRCGSWRCCEWWLSLAVYCLTFTARRQAKSIIG